MKLEHFSVKNFKGLRDVTVPVSRFVCLIGENNAGKSSFLQALLLFVEGRKLEASMYFDPGLPILISVRFKDISELDLALITNDDHRDRFRNILVAGSVSDATGKFIKLAKTFDPGISVKPFARALSVDLSALDNKSRFQIISYETNNTAFFSETVVLVEGDSELLVLPHVARVLNEEWTAERTGVAFCRVGGKGNIARYRDFFKAFEVRVCVVGDLDCLVEGFEQLGASEECHRTREGLFRVIDAYAVSEKIQGKINAKDIKETQESKARQGQFKKLVDEVTRYRNGEATNDEVDLAEAEFFSDQVVSKRRQILESVKTPEIVQLKRKLLAQLRQHDVYILERGTIEEYYPEAVDGPDKPSKAMNCCELIRTKGDVLALCDHVSDAPQSDDEKELVVILGSIYRID